MTASLTNSHFDQKIEKNSQLNYSIFLEFVERHTIGPQLQSFALLMMEGQIKLYSFLGS